MSHNQRPDRTESSQYRKSGRSSHPRNYTGGGGGSKTSGSGGGATAPPPGTGTGGNTHHHGNHNQPSLPSNRSFKKHGGNVQGGGPRGQHVHHQVVNLDSGTAPAALRAVQNGAHPPQQPSQPPHGGPNAQANVVPVKPADVVASRTSRAPRAPSANAPAAISDPKNNPAPATPVKAEASQSYTLQFGSISPGFMNGMQIPARTSSAPPNLDEQKRDQARHDSFRTPTEVPYPSAPRQQLPKDISLADQPSASEGYPAAKPKRDTQVSMAPPVSQAQKPSVHPIPAVPMQMGFHQPQVHVQFGGPNPQIQSQAMSATSLPMPMPMHMPLQIGNPTVQQPVFVPGLPHHHMQPQGILHPSQNLSFSTQMGPQIPPQVGSIGMNMASQFPQPQSGKYGPRKAVKITHPETHEELRLDGTVAPRSHPNVPPQSQPISSFSPARPSNYYTSSYNAFFQGTSSHTHPTPPQAHRYHNQVTVKPPISAQGERDVASIVSSPRALKVDSQKISKASQRDMESSSQSPKQSGVGPGGAALRETSKSAGPTGSESGHSLVAISVPPSASLTPSQQHSGMLAPAQDKQVKADGQSTNASGSASVSNVVIENPSKAASMVTLAEPHVIDLKHEDKKVLESSKGPVVTVKRDDQTTPVISREKSQEPSKIDVTSLIPSVTEPEKTIEGMSTSREVISEVLGTLPGQLEESSALEIDGGGLGNQAIGGGEVKSLISDVTAQDDKVAAVSTSDGIDSVDSVVTGVSTSEKEMPRLVPSSELSLEGDVVGDINAGDTSAQGSESKEKLVPEPNVSKTTGPRGKKKRKELLKKLDSSGPTSDLYLAYKGPEEKKETAISGEIPESTSSNDLEPPTSDVSKIEVTKEEASQSKAEPDDWEDVADTPKLETSVAGMQGDTSAEDIDGVTTKKYSRDFLLTFSEQFTELPEGFEMVPEITEALVVSKIGLSRDQYSGSGRVDRPRLDRRGSNLSEEDKWNRVPAPIMTGRDNMHMYNNMGNLRPAQVPNHGVLRNPRMQPPLNYPGPMHPGQMQSMVPQMGVPRNNPDSERWHRGTGYHQRGIMPSPQTPLAVMHKAERKYEIGKVTDEEQAKQRQLKGILNKLTPQNFERLFEQVQNVNIDNVITLTGVISQIFDKALMEPTFCEMYATFCQHLAAELPELTINDEKVTFKRLLLNKCQEEFERGEKEEAEANKVDEKGEAELSAEVREEKRLQARRRMLGNIRLIGELYKKRMLTERIMHECIKKLLGQDSQYQNHDEEDIESLCKLMSTIGEMIDHSKAKEHIDFYFGEMERLSNDMKLSSRVRFMLKDSIDLRKNKWQQRRKVEGPKKIDEVHRDAAQERQAQARGFSRTPSMSATGRRPSDFSPRGSNPLVSPSSHMGSLRPRGYGGQDARMEERNTLDSRPVPLPHRPLGEEAPFLGPQGGLARGMSRGHTASPGPQFPDRPNSGESRRVGPGLNGFSTSERTVHPPSREDPTQRYMPERSVGSSAYDQSSIQEPSRGIDKSRPLTPPTRSLGVTTQSAPSDNEERLREMSMSAIKEFYSAKDEHEVALCIKELDSPSFHPSMVSLWVTDSFERKDKERDHLTKLLIALTKNKNEIISQDQLIRGFSSSLTNLEDAVNDAPKAAEYLGRMFASTVLESVAPLNEIGSIILEGGEEPGRLVEIGLAAEVLGTTLEIIAAERSDSAMKELLSGTNLKLEMFRPPDANKALRLDKFM